MRTLAFLSQRVLYIVIFVIVLLSETNSAGIYKLTNTEPLEWTCTENDTVVPDGEVRIICYNATTLKPQLQNLWRSVHFTFNSSDDSYKVYHGASKEDVRNQHENRSRLTKWFLLWRILSLPVSPFNRTCVLVEAHDEPVHVRLHVNLFDGWIFARLLCGLLLFYLASKLSKNILFYYGTGITFGVLASAIIVIFILSRFIPRKGLALGFLAASFSATAFLFQRWWQDFQNLAYSHLEYIIAYFLIAGLVSFGVCYYKGPVSNPRLLNLIKWSIQLVSVVLIYSGTQIPVVSGTIVLCVVLSNFVPTCGLGQKLRKYWRRKFPPKIRLLTEEEYQQQATEETRKALEELRAFCQSPNCQAWKTISRLNSPSRFAKWVDGASDHIQETEYLEYDRNPSPRMEYVDDLED